MSTFSAKPHEVNHDWYVIDASGRPLGRLASEIARRLRGKHKPIYTPHVDTGDYIIVVNADKVHVTGRKATDKMYHHHTGYVGNLKSISFEKLQARAPGKVIELAVKGMLPKNNWSRDMFRRLKVYAGDHHPHEAQKPEPVLPFYRMMYKDLTLHTIIVYSMPDSAKDHAVADINSALSHGSLEHRIAHAMPLSDIAAGNEIVEGGKVRGAVILNISG